MSTTATPTADPQRQAELQPSEQWTRVRRKGKGRRNLGTGHTKPPPSDSVAAAPSPSAPFLSLSDVQQEHQRIADPWRTSDCCRKLKDIVASEACVSDISQAICFGIGTFDPADAAWEVKRRTHIQLAAFLFIVEQLKDARREPIRCLFQEPLFNSTDKLFIQNLGHEVVDSPKGFDLVGPTTMVFGVHLYRDIYSRAISNHSPAIFVGTPYDIWQEFHGANDLDWARMEQLDQQCDKARFPEDQGHTTFSSTSIHWKRRDET